MFYTYRLLFPDGTYYAGSCSNIENRLRDHKTNGRNNRHQNHKVQKAWNNFGDPQFLTESYSTRKEALEAEQKLINEAPALCLNIMKTATLGATTHSEDSKNKIASSMFGTANGKGNAGRSKSEEHKEKISSALKGLDRPFRQRVKVGDKTFNSITEASRFFSITQPAMFYASKKGNFRGMNVELLEEDKEMTISDEHRAKISKKVKIGKTIFASMGEAAEHFGVCRETIKRAVKKNDFRGQSARIVE